MLIFVYEHLTSGGLLSEPERSSEMASLAAEGRGMLTSLVADLAAVSGVEVCGLCDRRVDHGPIRQRFIEVATTQERDAAFDRFAAEADWTVIIAPEIGGALAERCRRVIEVGGRLLGGSLAMVLLASDKHKTARHLAAAGIPVPRGIPFMLGEPWPDDFPYPAVWKPLDGAGSAGLRLVENSHASVPLQDRRPGRLEEFGPSSAAMSPFAPRKDELSRSERRPCGVAASVAFLCGPAGCLGLPPCRQHLAEDFRYVGGSLLLEPILAPRASRLARRTIETLPGPLGYVGVDLVLSSEKEAADVVIEINPRLTTSYVGLSAACRENLAAAMLATAAGQPFSLSFRDEAIEWRSDGRVQACGAASFTASA